MVSAINGIKFGLEINLNWAASRNNNDSEALYSNDINRLSLASLYQVLYFLDCKTGDDALTILHIIKPGRKDVNEIQMATLWV